MQLSPWVISEYEIKKIIKQTQLLIVDEASQLTTSGLKTNKTKTKTQFWKDL